MERFSVSAVKKCAITEATSSGRITFISCVSSNANTMPVNGDRMVPPRIAPMLISGQKPRPSLGRNMASRPPSAPPIISSGASTPPEVPEPSENAQMNDLTSRMPQITWTGTLPWSSAPMVSYPTPSACGKIRPPNPTAKPPKAGHHIQWMCTWF